MKVYVYTDSRQLLGELVGGGTSIAEQLNAPLFAIVDGKSTTAQDAIASGANAIVSVALGEGCAVDDVAPSIAALVSEEPSVLIVGATKRGKAIAGRVAALVGTAAITDVKNVEVQDGAIRASHMIYGGVLTQTISSKGDQTVLTVGAGLFEKAAGSDTENATVVDYAFVEPKSSLKVVGSKPLPTSSTDLSSAKTVVCAGKGVATKEDLSLVRGLADALGGEVGFTRPVVEREDPITDETTYIGVSGVQIKPELYVGVAVSGQTQHMIGAMDAKVVVGINTDSNAPIFRQCDYGVVADLHEFVPLFTKAIQEA